VSLQWMRLAGKFGGQEMLKRRNSRGMAAAELGVSMAILFVVVLPFCIEAVHIAFAYAIGNYIHNQMLREACLVAKVRSANQSDYTPYITNGTDMWNYAAAAENRYGGLGYAFGINGLGPEFRMSELPALSQGQRPEAYLDLVLRLQFRPLIPVPVSVDWGEYGIVNGNFGFSFRGKRPIEDVSTLYEPTPDGLLPAAAKFGDGDPNK